MASRRDFLKSACSACAVFGLVGISASFLESCSSLSVVKTSPENNVLKVPLKSFGDKTSVLVRSEKMEFDILLVKKSDSVFVALLLECTHQHQPLTASGNTIHCSAHGSMFDLDGNVLKSPAALPLKRYATSVENGNVVISLS